MRIYRFIRFLSLDIVLGAAAGSILACKVLELYPPLSYKLLLPLAVWILYLSDHLFDGLRHSQRQRPVRYALYYKNAKAIFSLIIILFLISAIILIFSFDELTFHFGILAGVVVILYFIFQQLRFKGRIRIFPKEPVIAFVYTMGIWGEPLLMFKGIFRMDLYLTLICYVLLVLMNVQLYSNMQVKEDIDSGYSSLAGIYGTEVVSKLNLFIGSLVGILSLYIILWPTISALRQAGIIILFMDISLISINLFNPYIARKDLVGLINDAVFFLPAIALLI